MLAIAFRFPAGRYHATPWGRHVNEAEVEWPPSPWRILRALIATWHRKGDSRRYPPESVLEKLVGKLADSLPVYHLPPGVRAHSRHYMPQGKFKSGREDTALIFDAFVRLKPTDELIVAWPELEIESEERLLLESLLRDLGFLGRAESWVEARMLEEWGGTPNCCPSELSVDTTTGEELEPVRLIAPVEADDYVVWRDEMVAAHGLNAKGLKKKRERLLSTLPGKLINAMRVETGDLHQVGWSSPPGARFVTYQRPHGSFTAHPKSKLHRGTNIEGVTSVRLALSGKPLPRIEDALRIGEIARMAAMKQAERVSGGEIPPALSGHGLPKGNRHGHAFYLPEDADRDGHIDHVLIHAPDGLPLDAVTALDRIEKIWDRERGEWQVMFEGYGSVSDFPGAIGVNSGSEWISLTPYLHPWFAKKRFGVVEQVRRECRERGLPEPEVNFERIPFVGVDGKSRRPVHFHRFRSRRGLTQPDTRGCFLRLAFPESIGGPLALGFGCHYGLGMFLPMD